MGQAFPRAYDKIFNTLFDTYLNLPSSKDMPNLENEFIRNLVPLFKQELADPLRGFIKSKQYLQDLNGNYKPSAETKAKMRKE